MPGGDGTVPMGIGPMTGRAGGSCAGYPFPGFGKPIPGSGFGVGFGRALGRHSWAFARGFGCGRGLGCRRTYPYISTYYGKPCAYPFAGTLMG